MTENPLSVSIPSSLKLLNFGRNVQFGKDFRALITLPDFLTERDYQLTVRKLRVNDGDTTALEPVFEQPLDSTHLMSGLNYFLSPDSTDPRVTLQRPGNRALALVSIPNKTFPNAPYRLEVTVDGERKPIAQAPYYSRWVDIPISLLNVNVALDMLRFILPKDKLEQMKEGDRKARQKAFEQFWNPKDPTPDTEYNELMAEYYRRIDYTFLNYTSSEQWGYESDQGKVYIRNGPPDRVERKFPPGKPSREIWYYDNGDRSFTFRATTGFGDYELIDRS